MKNLIRILNVFFLLTLISTGVFGQTEKDTVAVLQKCIEMKDFQQLLPLNSDGTRKQLNILNHGVSFPAGTNILIAGSTVALVDRAQLEKVTNPYYLLFWDFRISQNRANAGFVLNNKTGKEAIEMARFIVEAEKNATDWEIIDIKMVKVH
ncbi:MAG TPA: hypothetical protein PL123_00365 [Bacteroidales bacterium]|nr:hypothetical protein [Bacteroidales bacterium]